MTNLKLTSNFSDNSIIGLGKLRLIKDEIIINLEPQAKASLIRNTNEVCLADKSNSPQTIRGKCQANDVFILNNNVDRLTAKITADIHKDYEEFKDNNIIVNTDPIVDSVSKKQKNMLTIGILLLLMLIISVIFGVNQKNNKKFKETSLNLLNESKQNYEQSIQTIDLDQKTSRELFIKAKDGVTKLQESGFNSPDLTTLVEKITNSESDILGEKKVTLNDFLDLTLQVSGFKGSTLTTTGEEIFILDSDFKSTIQINAINKKARIAAGKDRLEGLQKIASYEDILYSLNDDGIYQINNEKVKVIDKDWGNESLFSLYSANIYLVDKSLNKIYRFSGKRNGENLTFSQKNEWLAPGIEVDLSKTVDMSIDGSIWLLSNSGKITKFTNGNPIVLNINGLIDPLKKPIAIYTNEKLKYVYILDSETGRIVVLEKNGNFKMQYLSEDLKSATDLMVVDDEKKIITLNGSKLMTF